MMKQLLLTSTLVASLAVPAIAQPSDERIKELALEAILENPDIIAEAIQILQERQRAQEQNNAANVFKQNRDVFLSADNAPVLGNPNGEITIVEFFDYNCSYCRRAFEAERSRPRGIALPDLLPSRPLIPFKLAGFPVTHPAASISLPLNVR